MVENKPLLPATIKTEKIIFAELPIPQTKNVAGANLAELSIHPVAVIRRVIIACGKADLCKRIDGLSIIIVININRILLKKGTLFLFCGMKKHGKMPNPTFNVPSIILSKSAIKAIGKNNAKAIESSVTYKALLRIGTIYKLEESLKSLSSEKHLAERQSSIKPLVEEYFAWAKEQLLSGRVLPKSETAKAASK